MAILTILSSGAFMWLGEYRNTVEADSASKSLVSALRTARSFAVSGKDSKNWGVYVNETNNKFILFRDEGEGFDGTGTNLVSEKEETFYSSLIRVKNISLNNNGINDGIIFSKTQGETAQNGSIRIEGANNSRTCKEIQIEPSGLVSIQACP